MKITVTTRLFIEAMRTANRDYYSWDGAEAILDYYDDIDENIELDPIAIACEWNEYGVEAALSIDDLYNDFGYLLDGEDDYTDEMDADEKLDFFVELLENRTTVYRLTNGNVLLIAF